jgi:hypothetical protein
MNALLYGSPNRCSSEKQDSEARSQGPELHSTTIQRAAEGFGVRRLDAALFFPTGVTVNGSDSRAARVAAKAKRRRAAALQSAFGAYEFGCGLQPRCVVS